MLSQSIHLPPIMHTYFPYCLAHMHILTYSHTTNSISHECVYLPNTLASASVSLFDHKVEKQRVGQERERNEKRARSLHFPNVLYPRRKNENNWAQ